MFTEEDVQQPAEAQPLGFMSVFADLVLIRMCLYTISL